MEIYAKMSYACLRPLNHAYRDNFNSQTSRWLDAANESIYKKTSTIKVKLPCVPVEGNRISLLSFKDEYGFTKNEIEWLEQDGYEYHVDYVSIYNGFIVLELSYK